MLLKRCESPAAARAFGFRSLPEPLRTGKGLVGFGIVSEEKVSQEMFEKMPHLEMGAVGAEKCEQINFDANCAPWR